MSAGTLAPRLPLVRWSALVLLALPALLLLLLGVTVTGALLSDPPRGLSPIDAVSLDAWMAAQVPASPLVGLGAVFVAEGAANGVDPRFLAAVARHESVLGTEGPGARVHNAFGWGPHIPFASWEDGIATAAEGLAQGYLAEGLTTIPAIGAKWAPIGAANDPGGLNNHWVGAVSGFYEELGGDATASVALVARGARPVGASVHDLTWPAEGALTSPFGPRWGRLHAGIDVAGSARAPILAAAAGVVTEAGWQGGYGNRVVVDHGGGFATVYAHLVSLAVAEGRAVRRGEAVGGMGATGNATGVHLHFEVRVGGEAVDPMAYLPSR